MEKEKDDDMSFREKVIQEQEKAIQKQKKEAQKRIREREGVTGTYMVTDDGKLSVNLF